MCYNKGKKSLPYIQYDSANLYKNLLIYLFVTTLVQAGEQEKG